MALQFSHRKEKPITIENGSTKTDTAFVLQVAEKEPLLGLRWRPGREERVQGKETAGCVPLGLSAGSEPERGGNRSWMEADVVVGQFQNQ
jgi:hypothetical protein